jgi:hypothetical protein
LFVATPGKRHFSVGRIQNAFDQRGELFERFQRFCTVVVTIVNAAHAANDMSENTLSDIALRASARHQGPRGPSEIVMHPSRHWRPAISFP